MQEAKQIYNSSGKGVVFGGKKLFQERQQGKISREDFEILKLSSIYSVGAASDGSNRKFQIISSDKIIFQPSRQEHFELTLPKLRKNLAKDLERLINLQGKIPITYHLDTNFIWITFENNDLYSIKRDIIPDRIFAIDLNPNYIGYAVVDWKSSDDFEIIDSGVFSTKAISNIKQVNHDKLRYEQTKIADRLVNLAKHFGCETFALEKLQTGTGNRGFGRHFNRLCNNSWNKNWLIYQIKKRCSLNKIQTLDVLCQYSSYIGNLAFRDSNLPDQCLAAIEISRRAYEFDHQYVKKDKNIQKNIVFLTSEKLLEKVRQSLEELHFSPAWKDFKDLCSQIKIRKLRYRVLLEDFVFQEFSAYSIKSQVKFLTNFARV
jgi:hypothetical protein